MPAVAAIFSLLLMAVPALAQASAAGGNGAGGPSPAAEKVAPVRVARFEKPPMIDGALDEDVWRRAGLLKDFVQTQPLDNAPATHPTEVLLGYDDKFLYVGIRASDEKGQVRATVAKRDDLSVNDYTALWLDTFNDNRRAYVLLFNPLGVQADGVFTEAQQAIDYSVDVVMQSKGVVTSGGYTVEAAIPFSSLRYEAGKGRLWGVHALRKISHSDEWDSWMPLRRESRDFSTSTFTRFLEQAGRVTGIEGVGGERTLELIPNLTLSETGRRVRTIPRALTTADPALIDGGRFVNPAVKTDVGLTAKLTLTPGVTLDAAVNPDFAQVEADQPVVTANQRYPVFFDEKRPFFLEGIEIFRTPIKAVHTRTIIDPDAAIKLTGKRGPNSFGLMLASDNAPGNFSEDEKDDPATRPDIERFIGKNATVGVLRLKHDIGKESNVGLIATSYNFVEKHNELFGLDSRLTPNPKTVLQFQLLATTSRRYFYDPAQDKNIYRTGNGLGYYAQVAHNTRHLGLTLTGDGRTPDYRADVGFTTLTNINKWYLTAQYNSEPKKGCALISWSAANTWMTWFDWQGRSKYGYVNPRVLLNFKRQTYLNLTVFADYLKLLEEEFGLRRSAARAGAFSGGPERSTVYHGYIVDAGSAPSKKYSFTLSFYQSWKAFDYDFGAGPRFPRVSPAALRDPNAPLDPGTGLAGGLSSNVTVRPTDALSLAFDYTRSRLVRDDTKRVAYDQSLYSLKALYQFTRFTFVRARTDYDTLRARVYGQFLAGYAPNPGTAVYVGYDDDLNLGGFSPFTGQYEPGFRRNSRTFFLKMSYLFRRGL